MKIDYTFKAKIGSLDYLFEGELDIESNSSEAWEEVAEFLKEENKRIVSAFVDFVETKINELSLVKVIELYSSYENLKRKVHEVVIRVSENYKEDLALVGIIDYELEGNHFLKVKLCPNYTEIDGLENDVFYKKFADSGVGNLWLQGCYDLEQLKEDFMNEFREDEVKEAFLACVLDIKRNLEN